MEHFNIPKKVNRHVIKAIDFLQTSRTDFVHIQAIKDQVRRSLRNTKPVSNLEAVIKESLRKQTDLGIVTRSGTSMFAMTLAFQGLRSDRKSHKIKKNEAHKRAIESLTADEIASVRKILRGVQKPLGKTKSGVLSRALFKRKSGRNALARHKKLAGNSTSIICDKFALNIENFNVPKKVNRHVFKAVRYFTSHENCEFVPLDKIKMEVKWSMKNLNPLQNFEAVIERSLANLSNMGVLSERFRTYRLNPVESLSTDSSFVIFGKVSKSFFNGVPIGGPKDSHGSYTYLEKNGSGFSSMDLDIRPAEGVLGSASSIDGGPFQVPMVISGSLSQKKQVPDELQNLSYMHLDEPILVDSQFPVSQGPMQSPTYNYKESEGDFGKEPNVKNTSLIELSPFHAPLVTSESHSQGVQGANESQNIEYMRVSELPLDEPMSEQTSPLVPKTINFRASEGVFAGQPENGNSFCFQLPLASENISTQEMHNTNTDCEMGLGASSKDLHDPFSRAAQSFHESWLQSISNNSPTLFSPEVDSESEKSSSVETSKHLRKPDEQ